MKNKIILVLSALLFLQVQFVSPAANKKQKIEKNEGKEFAMSVSICSLVGSGYSFNDRDVIEWINFGVSPASFDDIDVSVDKHGRKNGICPDTNFSLLMMVIDSGRCVVAKYLIELEANSLHTDIQQKDALDHLIDAISILPRQKRQLARLLIDLMVRQGVNIKERLKGLAAKEKELQDTIIEYQEGDINQDPRYRGKQKELADFQAAVGFVGELIGKLETIKEEQDIKKRKEEYQAAEPVLIGQEQQLVVPQVVQTNIKGFFELPKGDQIVVHQMKKAIRKNNMKKLQELIAASPKNIELQDERGYTPLLQAVYTNKGDAVKLLIDKGANLKTTIKAADDSLVDALALARLLGHKEMVDILAPYWAVNSAANK